MRILGLALSGTVIMALLGGMSGVAVAQDEDPWLAAWLAPTEEGVFGAAGEGLPPCTLDTSEREAQLADRGSGKLIRNLVFTCEAVFSDPRLTGTQTTRFSERCFTGGGCVNWGTMAIVGADGTWSGWFQGIEEPNGQTDLHVVLTGSGAYEGLTNMRHANGGFSSAMTQTGVIFSSDPPPVSAE